MAGPALVRRPTEKAAKLKDRPLPPVRDLLVLHLTATVNQDRYGARLFYAQLERALGGVR